MAIQLTYRQSPSGVTFECVVGFHNADNGNEPEIKLLQVGLPALKDCLDPTSEGKTIAVNVSRHETKGWVFGFLKCLVDKDGLIHFKLIRASDKKMVMKPTTKVPFFFQIPEFAAKLFQLHFGLDITKPGMAQLTPGEKFDLPLAERLEAEADRREVGVTTAKRDEDVDTFSELEEVSQPADPDFQVEDTGGTETVVGDGETQDSSPETQTFGRELPEFSPEEEQEPQSAEEEESVKV